MKAAFAILFLLAIAIAQTPTPTPASTPASIPVSTPPSAASTAPAASAKPAASTAPAASSRSRGIKLRSTRGGRPVLARRPTWVTKGAAPAKATAKVTLKKLSPPAIKERRTYGKAEDQKIKTTYTTVQTTKTTATIRVTNPQAATVDWVLAEAGSEKPINVPTTLNQVNRRRLKVGSASVTGSGTTFTANVVLTGLTAGVEYVIFFNVKQGNDQEIHAHLFDTEKQYERLVFNVKTKSAVKADDIKNAFAKVNGITGDKLNVVASVANTRKFGAAVEVKKIRRLQSAAPVVNNYVVFTPSQTEDEKSQQTIINTVNANLPQLRTEVPSVDSIADAETITYPLPAIKGDVVSDSQTKTGFTVSFTVDQPGKVFGAATIADEFPPSARQVAGAFSGSNHVLPAGENANAVVTDATKPTTFEFSNLDPATEYVVTLAFQNNQGDLSEQTFQATISTLTGLKMMLVSFAVAIIAAAALLF